MIRENCGTHSITLLFSFMCGSLLSLIYLIPNVPFRFAEDMPVIAAAASFSIGALTCGTACCITVQPLSTVVLGCAAAFEMYSAVTELSAKRDRGADGYHGCAHTASFPRVLIWDGSKRYCQSGNAAGWNIQQETDALYVCNYACRACGRSAADPVHIENIDILN